MGGQIVSIEAELLGDKDLESLKVLQYTWNYTLEDLQLIDKRLIGEFRLYEKSSFFASEYLLA